MLVKIYKYKNSSNYVNLSLIPTKKLLQHTLKNATISRLPKIKYIIKKDNSNLIAIIFFNNTSISYSDRLLYVYSVMLLTILDNFGSR